MDLARAKSKSLLTILIHSIYSQNRIMLNGDGIENGKKNNIKNNNTNNNSNNNRSN